MATRASLLYGNEPDVSILAPDSKNYDIVLMRVLNWYSFEKAKSDARKYMRDYVKINMPSELKTFDAVRDVEVVNTYGWIARVILREGALSDKHMAGFSSYLTKLLNNTVQPIEPVVAKVVTSAPKPSIQDSMKEKISEYLGELEGSFDVMINDKEDFSLYRNMQANQIPKPYVPDIKDWVKNKMREFIEAYEGKEAQVKEGYSNYTTRELKSIVKTLAQFIEDCDKYSEFKKANRKPRIVKPKLPGVQVKSLKFKKEDTELGLKSISATEIIGAQQVWFYNTKNRKLIVYKTESSSGIQVKGSSLQNYEPDMSCQKTLRKPAEQIKAMMTAAKVPLRKYMDTITSKPAPANGRVNAEMIILRAIK